MDENITRHKKEDYCLEFIRKDEHKIVEIWMTKQERDDQILQEKLKPCYKKYKDAGYLVAVYQSGNEDLKEYTAALLQYNRRRAVEKAMEA